MDKDYKVCFIPRLVSNCKYESFHDSLPEAAAHLNTIANYTLMLHECSLMPDHSNIGMIFRRGAGDEWVEVGDDGEEI